MQIPLQHIFITQNENNFLTSQPVNSTIAAFGSSNGKRDEKILEFRGLKPTHRACNLSLWLETMPL
ncbi:MAG: hypothetical protein DYH15_00250 [Nitrosomonas sp. PRO4]|nr:hypothetical protein [Nitrosomonas sp. PRO4]